MAEKMSLTVADAVDYKGFPAERSKTGGWVPAALILGIEIIERLSTMGIAVNLVTYLGGVMHLPSSTSANIVTDFMGTCFLLCLLGGFLADSFLGRYKTIAIFAAVQTLGLVAVKSAADNPNPIGMIGKFYPLIHGFGSSVVHAVFTTQITAAAATCAVKIHATDDSNPNRINHILTASNSKTQGTGMLAVVTEVPQLRPPPCHRHDTNCTEANSFQMAILYIALYLIAIGTGGLKSSISGFGTDQFDEKDEGEKAQMAYFFNRFFFFISIGTLTAVTVLVYLQDEVGRSLAYGICSVSMLAAIFVFLSGTKRYRYKGSSGSPIVQIFQVIGAAIRKRKMSLPYDVGMLYEDAPESGRIQHTDQFRLLDKAAIVAEGEMEKMRGNGPNPWKVCSVTKVEEVKMMGRLLPIWATTILFWTTYAQMITFSVEQASTMNRRIGSFNIPAGSLTVFFVAAILITLAVYDRLFMPLSKKWKGTPGFTSLQKIAIGLLLSTIGMGVAALVEMKRLSVAKSVNRSSSNLPISVFLLIPQFFLVGSGEAFIYTGQLDFFITQSPKGMKTMSTGLFLTTLSLGFFVSSFLVSVVKKVTTSNGGEGWLADNINYGRLDCFYWLLSILSVVNLVLYLICAVWYKPAQKPKPVVETCKFNANGEEKC